MQAVVYEMPNMLKHEDDEDIYSEFEGEEASLDPSNLDGKKEKIGRRRRRLSPEETRVLLQVFEITQRPTQKMRARLAQQLNMTSRNIQVWFQNRRAKVKRDAIESTDKKPTFFAQYRDLHTMKMPLIAPAPMAAHSPLIMKPMMMQQPNFRIMQMQQPPPTQQILFMPPQPMQMQPMIQKETFVPQLQQQQPQQPLMTNDLALGAMPPFNPDFKLDALFSENEWFSEPCSLEETSMLSLESNQKSEFDMIEKPMATDFFMEETEMETLAPPLKRMMDGRRGFMGI